MSAVSKVFQPLLALAVIAGLFGAAVAQPPIVQPGKPGEPSRTINAEEAIDLASIGYSEADVTFMTDMIPHHHQALVMSDLVAERTGRNEMTELAERITASQKDEIAFMQDWLRDHGEEVPDPTEHDAMHTHHDMAGMASPEEIEELKAASGPDFDRLFLELMIDHHQGAITMVDELIETTGSAQDPVLYEFTTDVVNDQESEIERMTAMLAGFSPDPRVGLAAGFRDAGEAISNLELVAALPKPDGFFDPEHPAGRPIPRDDEDEDDEDEADEEEADDQEGEAAEDEEGGRKNDGKPRPSLLSFSNTDMAFTDDVLVAGNYHGFNVYDISSEKPELMSSIVCPGGQGDVSIAGDLLIMSVQDMRARVDCGLMGVAGKVSEDRFRGLRIFDISDLTRPVQVGSVQTCRGSHTHTIVSGDGESGSLIVYNSGTSPVREEEEMEGCVDTTRYGDERTALFRIDIIEIPVERPQDAHIVDSPAVFADPESGNLAGLWAGGDHGEETQETNETDHCHDITVFPEKNLAAGACSGNGILFDISDPLNPQRIDEVVDPGFAYWHSATFNNDGTKVLFTDEWGGGSRPRCRASDPLDWGADAFYDIVDGELVEGGYFKMPAPQTPEENCVAHNGSIIPVPGRDIFVQAWYQGGVSVVDFTDSSNPYEIAFFDRGPVNGEELTMGGYWSTYWYDGRIYGTEIARGVDVFELVPSEHLSEDEIAAAKAALGGERFNPQTQTRLSWPDTPVVARAYADQLERSEILREDHRAQLDAALASFEADKGDARALASLASLFGEQSHQHEGTTRKRLGALAATLQGIAEATE
ncbi:MULTISPECIES: DUF305 domain-containing protein [unclassified Wenzhouxiangella]|uniref:DUF305 domain-containing protein n=1 Tax=unclassified Wenzhouxiangella TaxID=2613841 RepID=UPI000E3251B7|nr:MULTISPECIES: DUF305 domain-containing protein [unclassified Wenzhouxiangella]RFF26697.1 DUF305 domain-containing protein [Wenzhouxiangella sp. 15181]RFP69333.1 DUF305 domain-containing protein [Wenzhouxiangella sp. 15190]